MKPIDEQVVLVTGATDGIGKGTARELARMGATVLLHGRSQEKLNAVRQEIAAETANKRTGRTSRRSRRSAALRIK
jgi:NADP-dependent 3-hydroxy acid dehydrogenase YdfG